MSAATYDRRQAVADRLAAQRRTWPPSTRTTPSSAPARAHRTAPRSRRRSNWPPAADVEERAFASLDQRAHAQRVALAAAELEAMAKAGGRTVAQDAPKFDRFAWLLGNRA